MTVIGRISNIPVMTMETLLAHASGVVINTGTNDARAALAAVDALGPHYVPAGTYRVASNLTLNSAMLVMPGAVLKPDSGATVTIAAPGGQFPNAQWIDTSAGGKVVFTTASGVSPVSRWWGDTGDWNGTSGTNNAKAWQDMVAALTDDGSMGWALDLAAGRSMLITGFQVATHNTSLNGRARHASKFVFNPATDGAVCVQFKRSTATELFVGGLRDVAFEAPAGNTVQKIAMDLVDSSEIDIERVAVHNSWTSGALRSAAHPSIGLRFRGRELLSWRKLTIAADRPISVEANPNFLYNLDGVLGINTYLLILEPTEAAMVINSGAYVQNFVLSGTNVFTGGKDGILFVNAPGASVSCRSIVIENLRHESTATAGGSLIAIVADSGQVLSATIRNVQPTFDQNLKFRGIQGLTLDQFTFSGATGHIVLDVDNCDYVEGRNVQIQIGNYVDFHDTTVVVTCTVNAAINATALTISALSAPLARGTVLSFTGGHLATLTTDALPGTTTLAVAQLAAAINNGDTATRAATMQKVSWLGDKTTLAHEPNFLYTKIATPAMLTTLQREILTNIAAADSPFQAFPSTGSIRANATGGAISVFTPAAASYPGWEFSVKKIDSSANAVVVHCNTGSGETIDGATTYTLATQYKAVKIRSNGTIWDVMAAV